MKTGRNCLACFGPVEFPNFAVFQAFSCIRKNQRLENHGVLQRGTPEHVGFMGHETLNKYKWSQLIRRARKACWFPASSGGSFGRRPRRFISGLEIDVAVQ